MRSARILVGTIVVTLVAGACAAPDGSGSESAQDTTDTTAGVVATTTTEQPVVAAESTTTIAVETTTTTTIEETKPEFGVARVSPDRARAPIPSYRSEFALPVSEGDTLTLTISRDGDFEWTDVATGAPESLYDARFLKQVSTPPGGGVLVRTGVITGGPDWPAPYMERHRFFQSKAARAIEDSSGDRKSTRLNSSHTDISRMPSSA